MSAEKLQEYYKFFKENNSVENWEWYKSLKKWTEILQKIKKECKKLDENVSEEELNNCIKVANEESLTTWKEFLNRYLYMQNNGTAHIGQGFIYQSKKNQHRQVINDKIQKNPTHLLKILKADEISSASESIKGLINVGRNYDTVRIRFLKTLFPENFTSVDSPDKLVRLVNILEKKLSIKVEGKNPIERHQWLMNQLKDEDDVHKKQIFYWELNSMLENDLDLKKAIVYYGAPGTGKTYKAKKISEKFIDRWALKTFTKDKKYLIKTVQFHPSFSYEDFIEGIRPSSDNTLKLKSGVFKQFCKQAGEIEIKLWKNKYFKDEFKKRSFSDIKISEVKHDECKRILGIKDTLSKELTLQDIIEPAFFIIDEINRAELSRVFGELMYALEYRGYDGKITTQYSYLNNNEDDKNNFFWEDGEDGEDWFFIPQNVYIIGTMNTIDRSVDSFDFALRRRFMWEEILPDYDVIKSELNNSIGESLALSFEKLNNKITNEELLGRDYQIGHSYALNIKNKNYDAKEAKNFLWKEFIGPLIQEYLRGLGDSKRSNELLNEFKKVFGAE